LNSPKVYFVDKDFGGYIRQIEKSFFNPIKAMYHYNRIYNKHNERYLQNGKAHIKRFLYYLRGVLACRWIEKNRTLPPVHFQELFEATVVENGIKEKIHSIIELKKNGEECDMQVVDDDLMKYAMDLAEYYNEHIDEFRPEQEYVSADILDAILYELVCKAN
jgi:predicted nucleotidyltransferase